MVILLSGYDDFEYAQKAVELSVSSYVTKPVDYTGFKETVRKAVLKLEEALYKEKILQSARISLESIKPTLQERFLNAWITKGRENPFSNVEKLTSLGIEIDYTNSAFLIVIRIDETCPRDNVEEGIQELTLKELSFEWFLRGKKALFFKDEKGKYILFYIDKYKQVCQQALKYIEEIAEPFKESTLTRIKYTTSIRRLLCMT